MMEQIASDARRTFDLRVLVPDEAPDPPFDGESYPVLAWAAQPTSDVQKRRIADALIASGCRYLVCGGMEPDAWEDAADRAYLARRRRKLRSSSSTTRTSTSTITRGTSCC